MTFEEDWFSGVAHGIRNSHSLCHIQLYDTTLDEGSTSLLQDLFTTPTNKRYSLTVNVNVRFSKAWELFIGDVIRSNSCLWELKLGADDDDDDEYEEDDTALPPYSFLAALEGESNSILRKLTLRLYPEVGPNNLAQFHALITSLPNMMHLRELNVGLCHVTGPGWSAMLLQALNRNSSLWQVTAWGPDEPFSDSELADLKVYCKRNKQIHAILEASTETIKGPLQVWPWVFQSMRGCEMEASIILLVLKALGESVGW